MRRTNGHATPIPSHVAGRAEGRMGALRTRVASPTAHDSQTGPLPPAVAAVTLRPARTHQRLDRDVHAIVRTCRINSATPDADCSVIDDHWVIRKTGYILRRDTRRAVRRPVRRATRRDPNISSSICVVPQRAPIVMPRGRSFGGDDGDGPQVNGRRWRSPCHAVAWPPRPRRALFRRGRVG